MTVSIVIASNNRQKVGELLATCQALGLAGVWYQDRLARSQFPAEGLANYQQNALRKAQFMAQKLPEAWILGDDSGLELSALPNELGVRTARELGLHEQSDAAVNAQLLRMVAGQNRQARLTATLALVSPQGQTWTAVGTLSGQLAQSAKGAFSTSFDQLMIPDGQTKTLAEMPLTQRLPYLTRYRALRTLKQEVGIMDATN